jgi:hypothetical protein
VGPVGDGGVGRERVSGPWVFPIPLGG